MTVDEPQGNDPWEGLVFYKGLKESLQQGQESLKREKREKQNDFILTLHLPLTLK